MGRIACVGLVLVLLAGCATLQNRGQLRDEALDGYAAALRWGDFESASRYVDPAVRAEHPPTAQQKALYSTIRVAEYDASGLTATSPDTVEQTAHIHLIVKSSQRVYSVVDHQTWHWDSAAKRWWLETGLPDVTPHGNAE